MAVSALKASSSSVWLLLALYSQLGQALQLLQNVWKGELCFPWRWQQTVHTAVFWEEWHDRNCAIHRFSGVLCLQPQCARGAGVHFILCALSRQAGAVLALQALCPASLASNADCSFLGVCRSLSCGGPWTPAWSMWTSSASSSAWACGRSSASLPPCCWSAASSSWQTSSGKGCSHLKHTGLSLHAKGCRKLHNGFQMWGSSHWRI